jgi:hypothetical protein
MLLTILVILVFWTAASFVLGPIVGRHLKRIRHSTTNHLPPLPEGSILGKRQTGVS